MTRPSIESFTVTVASALRERTCAPILTPPMSPSGISSAVLSRNPTTSAAMGGPDSAVISHSEPTLASGTVASTTMPTTLLTLPARSVSGTLRMLCSSALRSRSKSSAFRIGISAPRP